MTSLLNVFGQIWHSYNNSEKVLDAEIFTYLDDKSGVYHFNQFWRRDLLYDIFVDVLKNSIAAKIPYLIGDMEESFINPFVEGVVQKHDLLNMTMVEETRSTVKRHIQDLISSFAMEHFTNKRLSNSSLGDELYEKTIDLLNQAQAWFTKLDTRELYQPELITRILQSIESHAQKFIDSIKNLLPTALFKPREGTYHPDEIEWLKMSINSAITRTANEFVIGFNKLFHKIPDLQIPPEIVKKIGYEFQKPELNVKKIVRSRNLEAYALKGNWREVTVNASLYLPPLALKLTTPITTEYLGIPIADVSEDRIWNFLQPICRLAATNREGLRTTHQLVFLELIFASQKRYIQ
ncbi:unnamed protein product [Rodentolepis nana]|uniref:DUF2357 domain-containing protein n=1 Tax=Rodentolepis nana TaxID=102285 RepID=A0A158QHU6_RODNA|nr:unnamed protein product [Rodentolepis nana]